MTADLIAALLKCKDYLGSMVQSLEKEGREPDISDEGRELLAVLMNTAGKSAEFVTSSSTETSREEAVYILTLKFQRSVYRHGFDPLSFLKYMYNKGTIIRNQVRQEAIPALNSIDPESCYLNFDILYKTDLSENEVEEIFDFVRDDLDLKIEKTDTELATALSSIADSDYDDEPIEESAGGNSAQGKNDGDEKKGRSKTSIRVDAEKLDQLINMVGEMVVVGANINQLAQDSEQGDLIEAVDRMSRILTGIRDGSLSLRMVPVSTVFSRYRRVVYELGREMGKSVDIEIRGGDTELDKNIIEKISDPLMHLIRNAVGHGLESPQERSDAGKPEKGHITLNAYHEAGDIVMEISDDGAGLDKNRILRKAKERKITGNEVLTDQDIFQFIFQPGFSTADAITNISGRGVGLDVVARNIEALRGRVEVDSKKGEGTTFRIRLPLTLANIDGFLVTVGRNRYVIPLESMMECMEFDSVEQVVGEQNFVRIRGEIIPFLDLSEWFEEEKDVSLRRNILVVQQGTLKAGILVDRLLGEMQSVIKPLGDLFKGTKGISGFTILGDGDLALIVDVPTLLEDVKRSQRSMHTRHGVSV